ncbi:hypothetical protein ACSFA0_07460 [Variovorax sp. LT1P1]|uniref:hypothetical protein n=1 Tax=Variovorax sp. LT1P1 TaxID=3443730 RepID=UPI003F48270E
MKTSSLVVSLIASLASLASLPAHAQERVWRCGNEYTNNAADAQKRGCKVMEGGNVTVVQTPRPAGSGGSVSSGGGSGGGSAARAPAGSPRVEGADQRARDGEARSVLQSELRKAEARQAELLKDYNNGEPEKQGAESRNYQKYLDRVSEMKAEIARNESDIAGIRRELGRLPPSNP